MWNDFRKEHGNSMTELALVFPFMLFLILGIADVGRGFTTYIALVNASRESARWVSLHPTDIDGARSRAFDEAASVNLGPGDITVSFVPDQAQYQDGDIVESHIEFSYPLLFNLIPGVHSLPMNVSASMRVMYKPTEIVN